MVAVRLDNLTKRFGDVTAVDNVSLEIAEGELFFLLGPSGCGKTTILRSIAGFEEPQSGRILFDGRDITGVPPHRRNTGMVFQNYALWPHMSVWENVAYGLKVRTVTRTELRGRVGEALEMVRMTAQRDRYPNQLSGGQQQRVALARALVINPGCLLLDEPLSNLDARLRLEMRDEIRRIHSETGVTTIYVTHDQKEALSLAERLAIISDGRIVQTGSPEDVYRNPGDAFVASFVGETNLLSATVAFTAGPVVKVETDIGLIEGRAVEPFAPAVGVPCLISIRPEDMEDAEGPGDNVIEGETLQNTFLGDVGQLLFKSGAHEIKVLVIAPSGRERPRRLWMPPERVLVFPAGEAWRGGGTDA